ADGRFACDICDVGKMRLAPGNRLIQRPRLSAEHCDGHALADQRRRDGAADAAAAAGHQRMRSVRRCGHVRFPPRNWQRQYILNLKLLQIAAPAPDRAGYARICKPAAVSRATTSSRCDLSRVSITTWSNAAFAGRSEKVR